MYTDEKFQTQPARKNPPKVKAVELQLGDQSPEPQVISTSVDLKQDANQRYGENKDFGNDTMNKTMNVTLSSNLGTSISPVKKAVLNQEVEADSKIDDAIKIKEQQSN